MKITSKLIMALAAIATVSVFMAESAQARKFNASRAAVKNACGSGGLSWGTGGSGEYGCANGNGWVICEANGQCEGGRNARRVSKK